MREGDEKAAAESACVDRNQGDAEVVCASHFGDHKEEHPSDDATETTKVSVKILTRCAV